MGGRRLGAFLLNCGSYATICEVQCIVKISRHGRDEPHVLQYVFKQDNQLELAFCMRSEMMEHRRKQVAAGMGAGVEGEVLAQTWDEKVLAILTVSLERFNHRGRHVVNVLGNIAKGFRSMRYTREFCGADVKQRCG